ncbi:MAG: hypothetical protein RLZZ184_1230 [Cyanobacteriota bacterium]
MIKTSLTRGLMAMVAITVPIVGSSVKANAQAVNSLAQTTEIFTVDTNQLDKHNPGKIDKNEGRGNPPVVVPEITGKQNEGRGNPLVVAPKTKVGAIPPWLPQGL